MHFLVVGAGALGSSLAVMLKDGNHDVSVFDSHRWKLEQIHDHGIILYSPNGEKQRVNVRTITNYRFAPKPDYILIAVKNYQVREVLETLKSQYHPLPPTIFFQDGFFALEKAQQFLDKEEIIPAIVSHFFMGLSYFEVLSGTGTPILYLDKKNLHSSFIKDALQSCSWIDCQLLENSDFIQKQWLRLMLACSLEPVGAIGKVNLKDTLSCKPQREAINLLATEIYELAFAKEVFNKPLEAILQDFWHCLDNQSGAIRITMAQDLDSKSKTEIEETTAWALKEAQKHNLKLSANQSIYYLIKAIEEISLEGKFS